MFILNQENSIAHQFIAELRSEEIQRDSMRFRKNMERLGEILAYEISKKLTYQNDSVQTCLGTADYKKVMDDIVLVTVLRAGLPFYQGFLNYFDKAESGFIAAYREPENEDGSFGIKMEYLASPSIEGKTLILVDPMLATGKSALLSFNSILKQGKPKSVHIASVIASRAGVNFLKENIPQNFSLWVAALDEALNHKSYIIPGLGDAGDLAFGPKL
jgi:uracil phosphoribosyltransferase